jgi:4-amino-4-deoxy-L-arabinose transferase-like glycosyltransferase
MLATAASGAILAAAATARLWDIGSKPGWQVDETVYTDIATNLATSGKLSEHIQYHAAWTPFLYHPPFYFLVLAAWFKLVGPGVPQARVLAAIASLLALCLLYRLIARLHGRWTGLVTATFLAFDGWLLYVQRVSYIENSLLVIVAAGLLLYQRALDQPSTWRFLLAGVVLGMAAVFKHTGFYVLPAVALNWLIVRREPRNHRLLLAAAGTVIVTYLAVMIVVFDRGTHDWYLQQTLDQLERVSYLRVSRGTLSSSAEFIHLMTDQYIIFIPSFGTAVIGGLTAAAACVRAGSLRPIRRNSLLVSWSVAGLVIFGASALRFDQYFELVLIPLYCLLWTEACRFVRLRRIALPLAAAAAIAVFAANVGTFYLRVAARQDNSLYQVQQYALAHIPRSAVVITEEEIGDEIPQPWCSVAQAAACAVAATYAITYTSYLQRATPPDDPAFEEIIAGASDIATFHGFKETVTVLRLRH